MPVLLHAHKDTPPPSAGRRSAFTALAIALCLTLCGALAAQDRPNAAGGRQHLGPQVPGYLPAGALSYKQLLPPYPVQGSLQDTNDVATLRLWQQPEGSPRLALARADAEMSYARFDEAFGGSISRAATPLLIHLLDRVESDADAALGTAKQDFARPRPYQRYQFEHVCGFAQPPAPDGATRGNSYPSGHTSYGWTAALVLAQVAPDRAPDILARGREYAESRLVCAVHFPTDLQGAMILTSAVLGRVVVQPEFQRELACAIQERDVTRQIRKQIDPECLALVNAPGGTAH